MKKPIIILAFIYISVIIAMVFLSGCGAFTSTTVCDNKLGIEKEHCLEEVFQKQNTLIDKRGRRLQ